MTEQVNKLVREINTIGSTEELRILNEVVTQRWKELNRANSSMNALMLDVGSKVKIKEAHLKGKGDRLSGKIGMITKMNRTRARVDFDGVKWNIPFSMLVSAV